MFKPISFKQRQYLLYLFLKTQYQVQQPINLSIKSHRPFVEPHLSSEWNSQPKLTPDNVYFPTVNFLL